MFTNDIFLIDLIADRINDYTDLQSCINFNKTCKKYYNKKLMIEKKLYYVIGIDKITIKIIKNHPDFNNLLQSKLKKILCIYDFLYNKNLMFDIHACIFEILLKKMITENKYKTKYSGRLIESLASWNRIILDDENRGRNQRIQFQTFINNNIKTIKKQGKINFWNNVIGMYAHSCNYIISYNKTEDKYLLYNRKENPKSYMPLYEFYTE